MSGHSANVWTHGKCDPLVYLEERGCIPLVLCEEGRENIQVKYSGFVFSTFLEIPGKPRVDETGVGWCCLPLRLQHPAQL